jgi:hypothetical protein
MEVEEEEENDTCETAITCQTLCYEHHTLSHGILCPNAAWISETVVEGRGRRNKCRK